MNIVKMSPKDGVSGNNDYLEASLQKIEWVENIISMTGYDLELSNLEALRKDIYNANLSSYYVEMISKAIDERKKRLLN